MEEIFNPEDTICAISTPAGVGGIAVIRLSGPKAVEIFSKVWRGNDPTDWKSHTAHFGRLVDPMRGEETLDECVATLFRGPNSFTGEDTVELSVHGSRWIQREAVELLIRVGARLASRGEFTQRALLNGRLDLAKAEAVADVIASSSRAAHRIASSQLEGRFSERINSLRDKLVTMASLLELELDFSEEDVEFADRSRLLALAVEIRDEVSRLKGSFVSGQAIKDGIPVAIIGATNAGKSSLLNALLGEERAIVSDIPGTTRDTVEETITLGDYQFRFIDTAGIRETSDVIEKIGIDRSLQALGRARIVIVVIDPADGIDSDTLFKAKEALMADAEHPGYLLICINKTDLHEVSESKYADLIAPLPDRNGHVLSISAKTGRGLDDLRNTLKIFADHETDNSAEGILITNTRHAKALTEALASINTVIAGLTSNRRPSDISTTGSVPSPITTDPMTPTSVPFPITTDPIANLTTDLIAEHLRQTIDHLSTITGTIPSTEILTTIFSRFCIGK